MEGTTISDLMINEQIRDKEIRLIGENGEQLGIMSAREALKIAEEAELDLVKIAPTAKPPVCKIVDYSKYKYEQLRREKEAKKKHRQASWQDETLSVQSAQPDVRAKLSSPIISIGGYLPKQPVDTSGPQRGRNTLGTLADEYGKVEMEVMPGDTAGVKAIIDGVHQWGKNLTVISTGPLTDIAAAITLAPDIAPQLRLVMMGGALTQQGNCFDMVSETNIMQDPESADLVLRSQADVTMIGLDVTHRCLLPSELTEPWSQIDDGVGRFFTDLASFMIKANEEADPAFSVGAPMHDPLAVAAALDPTLVQTFDIALRVDLATGDRQGVRGRTIGDMTRLNDPTASCTHVAIAVDSMRFLNMFTGGISALSQRLAK